jgi:hypothetical protein
LTKKQRLHLSALQQGHASEQFGAGKPCVEGDEDDRMFDMSVLSDWMHQNEDCPTPVLAASGNATDMESAESVNRGVIAANGVDTTTSAVTTDLVGTEANGRGCALSMREGYFRQIQACFETSLWAEEVLTVDIDDSRPSAQCAYGQPHTSGHIDNQAAGREIRYTSYADRCGREGLHNDRCGRKGLHNDRCGRKGLHNDRCGREGLHNVQVLIAGHYERVQEEISVKRSAYHRPSVACRGKDSSMLRHLLGCSLVRVLGSLD